MTGSDRDVPPILPRRWHKALGAEVGFHARGHLAEAFASRTYLQMDGSQETGNRSTSGDDRKRGSLLCEWNGAVVVVAEDMASARRSPRSF